MSDEENIDIVTKAKGRAIWAVTAAAILASATTLAIKWDEFITVVAKDKIESAYKDGVASQLTSTLQQTGYLSACHTGVMCYRQAVLNGGNVEYCDQVREDEEARAARIIENLGVGNVEN
jgi:hypothetical protein